MAQHEPAAISDRVDSVCEALELRRLRLDSHLQGFLLLEIAQHGQLDELGDEVVHPAEPLQHLDQHFVVLLEVHQRHVVQARVLKLYRQTVAAVNR